MRALLRSSNGITTNESEGTAMPHPNHNTILTENQPTTQSTITLRNDRYCLPEDTQPDRLRTVRRAFQLGDCSRLRQRRTAFLEALGVVT